MAQVESVELLNRFERFYRTYCQDDIADLAQKYPADRKSLIIDWSELQQFDPNLADDVRSNPSQLKRHAEEALGQYDLPVAVDFEDAHVRFTGLPGSTDIRAIRAADHGRLLAVEGIVRKATNVRPKITMAAFECQRCRTVTEVHQGGTGTLDEPHQCHGCERQGPFRIDYDRSEFVDAQKLRVQESPEGLRGGETPQSIDVNIEDDITGEVTAGDHVSVTGILKLDQQGSDQGKSTMFDLYMEGLTVEIEDEKFDKMSISEADEQAIIDLSNEPDIYEQVQSSIAPSIFGYGREKLAMALQLFSGVTKHLPDGSRTRGDLHMLLIGDPGTGKSALLQYVDTIAPRAVYSSGKGTTSAGLTASAVRDGFGDQQQWTLEAGALVLADGGIAAIDELDKMSTEDQSAMHEALEQQSVSVNKAGINATLKARCSLLGAANPTMGRFDRHQPLADQIDLAPPLISRFDLIFTVTDNPDEDVDAHLADHILQTNYAGELHTHRINTDQSNHTAQEVDQATEAVTPAIEPELLRKYIAFARRNCFPTLTDEAKTALEDFYVDLRAEGAGQDTPVPVTARKLEALIRLAEASARVRLSDTVEVADAERAIDIVRYCLEEIGVDPETGEYDADIVETGTSKTQRDRARSLLDIVAEIEREYDDGAPRDVILDRAADAGFDQHRVEDELERLNKGGELYKPDIDHYQTT